MVCDYGRVLKYSLKLEAIVNDWVMYQWWIQDFVDGGGAPTPNGGRQPFTWSTFFQKLHENERNWTEEGDVPRTSLDPPMPVLFYPYACSS